MQNNIIDIIKKESLFTENFNKYNDIINNKKEYNYDSFRLKDKKQDNEDRKLWNWASDILG